MVRFQSCCNDAALLDAAFEIQPNGDYVRRQENHPMRYWVVAGSGRVPCSLRAPDSIYQHWDKAWELVETCEGATMWQGNCDRRNLVKDVKHASVSLLFGGYEWLGAVDVRCDGSTTVENLTTTPPGSEEIVGSLEESETFSSPIDTASGREYFEVTSGDLVVIGNGVGRHVSVANATCGKWFWQIDQFGRWKQLVLWNELVDDNDECKNPYRGSRRDREGHEELHRRLSNFRELVDLRKERGLVSTAAEAFLRLADVEPLLKHTLVDFLTVDPSGQWWKQAELPDGFLDSVVMDELAGSALHLRFVVCDANSTFNKFHFETSSPSDQWLPDAFSKLPNAKVWAVPGGCALRLEPRQLHQVHFKLHNRTQKIVAMRLCFSH